MVEWQLSSVTWICGAARSMALIAQFQTSFSETEFLEAGIDIASVEKGKLSEYQAWRRWTTMTYPNATINH